MSRLLFAALALAIASPAVAADCTAEVRAAFEKQRTSKAFRVAMTQPTAEGPVQMRVDYMPPDRMLQTVVAPHMPGEQQTMLVGNRAFAGSGGTFEELLPHFVQSVISENQNAVGAPSATMGAFECLDKATIEGKELLAFRSVEAEPAKTAPDGLARTIYVDPASGLPAYNIVGPRAGGEPVMRAAYTYPTDIDIIAPAGATVQKQN